MTVPWVRIFACWACFLALAGPARAWDLTGTWKFSVDLDNGEHGDPVFVIHQADGRLSGTYRGPFGTQKVTGVLEGDQVTLEVKASGRAQTLSLRYTGKIETIGKMAGIMTRNVSERTTPGRWAATRDIK